MAIASERLIDMLRQTVVALKDSDQYQWGHSGACNCGHLAQVLTKPRFTTGPCKVKP